MTVAEAQALIFVGEALHELCTSLRSEQIEALMGTLDITQKVLCIEILSTIAPRTNDAGSPYRGYSPSAGKRETWAGLLQAAMARITAGPEAA